MARPFLLAAAEALEGTTQRNDAKEDWHALTLGELMSLLKEEVHELRFETEVALYVEPERVRAEALDVALCALFVWAKAGGAPRMGHRGQGEQAGGNDAA